MVLLLYATRAMPTLKRGYSLVRKWNSLPPEQQAEVQEQGRRAVTAIMAVKVAATAEGKAADPPRSWEEAISRVQRPGPAEKMAKSIVHHLQTVSQATGEEIAVAVGAAGKDDSTFETAMDMAREDGYIRRVGIAFRGIKWDTTEWADLELLDSPHVRQFEDRIVSFLGDFGLASLDHISGALGLEEDAPELRAALERSIYAESIGWYCSGVYGLPANRLEDFEPRRDLWAETAPPAADKDLGWALSELEAAVKGLAGALKSSGVEDLPAEVHDGGAGDENPYVGLRQVQELYETGVLTAEEFAAKKVELLQRI